MNPPTSRTAPVDVFELIAECPAELHAHQPRLRYMLISPQVAAAAALAGGENLLGLLFQMEW